MCRHRLCSFSIFDPSPGIKRTFIIDIVHRTYVYFENNCQRVCPDSHLANSLFFRPVRFSGHPTNLHDSVAKRVATAEVRVFLHFLVVFRLPETTAARTSSTERQSGSQRAVSLTGVCAKLNSTAIGDMVLSVRTSVVTSRSIE